MIMYGVNVVIVSPVKPRGSAGAHKVHPRCVSGAVHRLNWGANEVQIRFK